MKVQAENECFEDKYTLGRKIGKGNFSIVKKGKNKLTEEIVAVKIIEKTSLNEKDHNFLREEIRILMQVSHPNIIAFKEIFENDKYIYIVMEYIKEGNLSKYTSNMEERFSND